MPNRIIKESICRSDSIDSLSWFEEVLFYRLIVVCDDYGRFDGRPAVVKGSCFPLKDDITKKQIDEALKKLSTVGLVRGYEVQGRSFLQLTAWEKHQQIRAKNSKYPAPDETCSKMQPNDLETSQKKSSDCSGNQLISDDCNSPRNRESKYENRESYSRNGDAREVGEVRRFEDFLEAYPKDGNRFLAEREYVSLLLAGKITEDELVLCAKNYAEACKIQETPDRYIKNAENFLKDMVFEKYSQEKYKRPESKNSKNGFNNFSQRKYDYNELERQLLNRNLGGG